MKIDFSLCEIVAEKIRQIRIKPDTFTDPQYFPPPTDPLEYVAHYLFFMVAIDHRTSFKGESFEGYVDGKFYHGADLLYRLGMIKYEENPEFFSPKHMSKITVNEVRNWLAVEEPKKKTIHDPEIRAFLLRDAGIKLLKLYDGSILNLIKESKGYLYLKPSGGFIERLKIFRAYEDPVEKKPFLLAKFMERRGILKIRDPKNIQIPVDNHLTRVAIRVGIVNDMEEVKDVFLWKREATYEEDIIIRLIVRKAWKIVADKAEISPSVLDDFLWMFGRKTCIRNEPKCQKCSLRRACKAVNNPERRKLNEHLYFTWYY